MLSEQLRCFEQTEHLPLACACMLLCAVQQRLMDLGVAAEVRKLAVGDFMWIARERTAPVLGQLQPPPRHATNQGLQMLFT